MSVDQKINDIFYLLILFRVFREELPSFEYLQDVGKNLQVCPEESIQPESISGVSLWFDGKPQRAVRLTIFS